MSIFEFIIFKQDPLSDYTGDGNDGWDCYVQNDESNIKTC